MNKQDYSVAVGMVLYFVAASTVTGAWVHLPHLMGLFFAWAGLSLMTDDRNSYKWQVHLCNIFFLVIPWITKAVAT